MVQGFVNWKTRNTVEHQLKNGHRIKVEVVLSGHKFIHPRYNRQDILPYMASWSTRLRRLLTYQEHIGPFSRTTYFLLTIMFTYTVSPLLWASCWFYSRTIRLTPTSAFTPLVPPHVSSLQGPRSTAMDHWKKYCRRHPRHSPKSLVFPLQLLPPSDLPPLTGLSLQILNQTTM